MKVSLNGLFLAQPHTGTGQYTSHLIKHITGGELLVADPRLGSPPRREVARGEGSVLSAWERMQAKGAQLKLRSHVRKLYWEQVEWPRAAREGDADLLHSPYFALPVKRDRPAVVTIHDLIPMLLPAYRGSLLVRVYSKLQALACRSAAAILVDSECSRRDVLRILKVPPEMVLVIYLGVDSTFTPDRSGPSPLDEPYVFYIGGWDKRKNVASLLAAFEQIARRHNNLVLAIAGEPRSNSALFPDLRGMASQLGDRVRFLGRVDDTQKLELYRHAEMFVFPSLYEGFGLDPLEALACGCPVVCSNASSLPEVVGEAGLLVDARDPQRLAEAMARALDCQAELRQRGPEQAAKFTWQRTAEQTVAAYRSVLK